MAQKSSFRKRMIHSDCTQTNALCVDLKFKKDCIDKPTSRHTRKRKAKKKNSSLVSNHDYRIQEEEEQEQEEQEEQNILSEVDFEGKKLLFL